MIEPFTVHLVDHILFFLLGVLLPWQTIGAQRKLKELQFNSQMRVSLYIGNSIGLWVMALIVVGLWWWLERPFSSLGLEWTPAAGRFWSIGLVVLFLLVYIADATRDVFTDKGRQEVEERLSKELGILPRTFRSYLFFIPLAVSAGICEEIVFRGFFIGYFSSLFGDEPFGQVLAVAIPAVIFGVVHTYQGQQAIFKIVGMAVIFGTLYLFTGSIYLLIVLHTVVDLIGGAVGLFFPEPKPEEEYWTYPPTSWEEE